MTEAYDRWRQYLIDTGHKYRCPRCVTYKKEPGLCEDCQSEQDHSWVNQGVCCRKHDERMFPGMVVCPYCGDKRCPRAEFCGNICRDKQ